MAMENEKDNELFEEQQEVAVDTSDKQELLDEVLEELSGSEKSPKSQRSPLILTPVSQKQTLQEKHPSASLRHSRANFSVARSSFRQPANCKTSFRFAGISEKVLVKTAALICPKYR